MEETTDFIPAAEFEPALTSAPTASAPTGEFIPADEFESMEDVYGTTGQQVVASLEGLAQGIAGPLAPAAERMLGVKPEDIRARQEVNPITHGAMEATGLIGGFMAGVGAGGAALKAGEAAQKALGLAEIAAEAPLIHRIGSSAVQQAAEMAVLQSSDEVSKMILQDPDTSAETALAHVGLASALGGAGGALFTGLVSPLWKATAGPKVEGVLNALKDHVNGVGAVLPEQTAAAMQTLGISAAPEIKAALSANPKAIEAFNILKEGQNRQVLEGIDALHRDAGHSVLNSVGLTPEDVAIYSENEAGHGLLDTFKKEYQDKYGPIAKRLEQRDAEASGIALSKEAKLAQYGRMLEKAAQDIGTDSPYYKLYDEYGQRLMSKDTVGSLDKLKTEINNRIGGLKVGGDWNVVNALRDVKDTISSFQEEMIAREAASLEAMGIEGALQGGKDLVAERAAVSQAYKEFARMSDELASHLGVGEFRGYGTLKTRLADKIAPEELLRKFSFKGNADFVPFLQKNFPDTLVKVQENELKKLLKPAILSAKGEAPVNVKKLADIVEKGMAGQREYIESVLPKETISKIEAAKTLLDAVPNPKSSGTAGWMTKMFGWVPRNAMAGVAMLTDRNPLFGALVGETAQMLGRNIPDSVRLSYLRFLASSQPVKSEGFKAMADFIHSAYKAENLMGKAIRNLFQPGAQVLASHQMPRDRERLDKIINDSLTDSNQLLRSQMDSDVGHYLPAHQLALSKSTTNALQYLQQLKPQPFKPGPLDKPIQPSPAQEARYNRALDIAQQPAVVLQRIKDGTLQVSDVQDLNGMYPALYRSMASKVSHEMVTAEANEHMIPYKSRISMSLFLGQPLDLSMTPSSIVAAQPKPQQAPPQQGQSKGRPSALKDKTANLHQTASQQAERDRSSRK